MTGWIRKPIRCCSSFSVCSGGGGSLRSPYLWNLFCCPSTFGFVQGGCLENVTLLYLLFISLLKRVYESSSRLMEQELPHRSCAPQFYIHVYIYIYLCFENRLRPERRRVMCVDLFLFSCLSFLSVRMCVPERVLNSGRSGPDTPLVMIAIALLAAPCTRGRVERGFGRNLLRETFFTREQHPRIPVVVVTDSRRKERRRVWTRCEICR